MCVIMVVEKVRPTEQMLDRAFDKNKDGVGFAWREQNAKGETEVHWDKGINDIKDVKDLFDKLPMPFVGHFRASSPNMAVTGELTHPFPITKMVPLYLRGKTKGSVLFHNGFMHDWQRECKEASAKFGVKIPGGKWSDTRAIAFLCALYGPGFMEFISNEQKGIIYGVDSYEYYTGKDGWKKINDVWCSNNNFDFQSTRIGGNTSHRSTEVYCKNPNCCVVSPLDQDGYCPRHPKSTIPPPPGSVTGNSVKTETGGSHGTPSPFPQVTKGEIISLEVAERLHKQTDKRGNRKLGRGKIKEIRGCYADIAVGGKKEELALKRLKKLTRKLLSNGGLTH